MKKNKYLLTFLCAMSLVAVSVLGTLAYLTSEDSVTNTFTVGQVNITLDEAKVTSDGQLVPGAERVEGNNYHLIPGVTYVKDPTLTVKADSEETYVRMLVTFNCLSELNAIFAPSGADLTSIFNGYDANTWVYETESVDTEKNTITYEFRYKEKIAKADSDTELEALFESFTVPTSLTKEDLKSMETLKITVVGHAIQATGFEDEEEAWVAFEE